MNADILNTNAVNGAAPSSGKVAPMWAHLSALATFVVPFGNIWGPLMILLLRKAGDIETRAHARASLNFQFTVLLVVISLTLAAVKMGISIGNSSETKAVTAPTAITSPALNGAERPEETTAAQQAVPEVNLGEKNSDSGIEAIFGLILAAVGLFVICGVNLTYIIVNGVRAYNGKPATYPFAIPFLRS